MKFLDIFAKSVLGLGLLAAAPASHALSFASFLHLHPHMAGPQLPALRLLNTAPTFHDVEVGNRIYTVRPHEALTIKAPAGTPVYAADRMFRHNAKGSIVARVASQEQTVQLD